MYRAFLSLLALVALAAAAPAQAAGMLGVSPITMEFAGKKAISVEITNPGDEEVSVQLRVFSWRTDVDGDHYEPSEDIGLSPPIFDLQPKGRQVVRMVLLTPPDETREKAYRLFVDQLPRAEAAGVQMPVRMVMPMFVEPQRSGGAKFRPAAPSNGALQWSVARSASGETVITALNSGARRVRLVNLGYVTDGKPQPIQQGLAGYVLAGERRGWNVPQGMGAGPVEVTAQSEHGEVRATVALSPE